MGMECSIRTDLAVETQESLKKTNSNLRGVNYSEEKRKDDIKVSVVTIETENASKLTGRPRGRYVTIEAPQMTEDDELYRQSVSEEFAGGLKKMIHDACKKEEYHTLVVGLGNRDVTPDALGPSVVDHLYITRHLLREGFVDHSMEISALCPGVMAQTGIETSTIIQSLCREIRPDLVICIDALAAREAERLNTTIQVCDTGITPGAGVGNRRLSLNEESLGVPVIAIGVPTVISMPAMISHAMEGLLEKLPVAILQQYEGEIVEFIQTPTVSSMFVTPKNIDELIRRVSYTISEAINRFLT